MKRTEQALIEPRPGEALIAIALQLQARLDANDGVKRNLGAEAVLLRKFGFRNPEIATMIGSTPGSVAELISQAQKTPQKKARKGASLGKSEDQ